MPLGMTRTVISLEKEQCICHNAFWLNDSITFAYIQQAACIWDMRPVMGKEGVGNRYQALF